MVRSSLPSSSLTLANVSFEGGKFLTPLPLRFQELISHERHNELDLSGITSPLMYEKIAARQSVPQLYEAKLIVGLLSLSFPFLAPPNALNSNRKKK